jgi:hypothetical protein
MAFSFLDDIGDVLGGIADIGSAGAGIAGLFGAFGDDDNSTKKAAKLQRQLMQGLVNPDDPLYQNLLGYERERINESFAEGLRDLLVANRRAGARGTPYLINPERVDESRAQAFAKMREGSESEARDRARTYLATAAGLNAAQLPYAADESARLGAAQTVGGIQSIFDTIGGISGLLNGDPGQTVNINTPRPSAQPIIHGGARYGL